MVMTSRSAARPRPPRRHRRRGAGAALPALLLALLGGLAAAAPATAADHQVTVRDFVFEPATVHIQPGDTVTWTNAGGHHNVVASNGSFRCANGCDGEGGDGDAATNAWSVTRTFGQPGTVNYFCEVHGSASGLGMAGQVVVADDGGGDEAGTLRFLNGTVTAAEGASARIRVVREGGDDGAVGVSFSTSDGSAAAGADYQATSGTLSWPDGVDGTRFFDVQLLQDTITEPTETINLGLSSPTGGATLASPSSATLRIEDDDQTPGGSPGSLAFASATSSAAEDAGQAVLQVVRSGGTDGAVSVRVTTSDGSATAGADYTVTDVTVSWGNGESGTRTVTVPLLGDSVLEGNETVNLGLSQPTGGATLASPSAATLTLLDDDLPTGPCQPDDDTLCLHDGRFQVQVRFRAPGGPERMATRIPLTERAGLFWFFNEANVEMLLKVQNACVEPFDRWWVFVAATTNVEYHVTVVDTEKGVLRNYDNSQGTIALPVADTDAFATCP
jgi:plastocyanin